MEAGERPIIMAKAKGKVLQIFITYLVWSGRGNIHIPARFANPKMRTFPYSAPNLELGMNHKGHREHRERERLIVIVIVIVIVIEQRNHVSRFAQGLNS